MAGAGFINLFECSVSGESTEGVAFCLQWFIAWITESEHRVKYFSHQTGGAHILTYNALHPSILVLSFTCNTLDWSSVHRSIRHSCLEYDECGSQERLRDCELAGNKRMQSREAQYSMLHSDSTTIIFVSSNRLPSQHWVSIHVFVRQEVKTTFSNRNYMHPRQLLSSSSTTKLMRISIWWWSGAQSTCHLKLNEPLNQNNYATARSALFQILDDAISYSRKTTTMRQRDD